MSKSRLHLHCDDLWKCKTKIDGALYELKQNNPIRAFILLDEMMETFEKCQVGFREEALNQDKELKNKGLHLTADGSRK